MALSPPRPLRIPQSWLPSCSTMAMPLPASLCPTGPSQQVTHPSMFAASFISHILSPPDEIALYDRQIRLWGMAAQAKIQNANILLITIRALANEIAKNLVLAGVGSLTLLDNAIVAEADLG